MAAEQPKSESEEICPMCKRPKRKHTLAELNVCSRKMTEFQTQDEGGAGIT